MIYILSIYLYSFIRYIILLVVCIMIYIVITMRWKKKNLVADKCLRSINVMASIMLQFYSSKINNKKQTKQNWAKRASEPQFQQDQFGSVTKCIYGKKLFHQPVNKRLQWWGFPLMLKIRHNITFSSGDVQPQWHWR